MIGIRISTVVTAVTKNLTGIVCEQVLPADSYLMFKNLFFMCICLAHNIFGNMIT